MGTRAGGEELRRDVEGREERLEVEGQIGIAEGRKGRARGESQREREETVSSRFDVSGGGMDDLLGENLPTELRRTEEGKGTYADK